MIVVDVNLLLYAYHSRSPYHSKAQAWIERVFSEPNPIGLPWQTVSAFLRISTNKKLVGNWYSIEEAAHVVDEWVARPNVRMLSPGDDHWRLFRRMVVEGQASSVLVSDAHLAALTIEYGGVLHTADRDFARFPGLRWMNPLI
jgi:toxin-antitoxin system PIN domain toxin